MTMEEERDTPALQWTSTAPPYRNRELGSVNKVDHSRKSQVLFKNSWLSLSSVMLQKTENKYRLFSQNSVVR